MQVSNKSTLAFSSSLSKSNYFFRALTNSFSADGLNGDIGDEAFPIDDPGEPKNAGACCCVFEIP